MVTKKEFLERWTGDIEQEFTSTAGDPVSWEWAPDHPKAWSSARAIIDLVQETMSTPAFSSDEDLLAVGVGKDIHIYNVATQDRLAVLTGHYGVVENVRFSPTTYDGDYRYILASHSGVTLDDESEAILWKLDGNGQLSSKPQRLEGQLGLWGSSSFTPDGKMLIFISNNESTQFDDQDGVTREKDSLPCINLWSIEERTVQHRLLGHTDQIQSVTVSPDGKHHASASWDGTGRIWDAATGACIHVLGPFATTETTVGQMWSTAFSPNGKHVAISQESPWGLVHVCEVSTGKKLSSAKFHVWTRSLAWSPDGSLLACGADPGTVAIWDPLTDEEKTRWALKFDDYGMGTMARPRAVKFLGQDKIVFQLNEGTVWIYDWEKKQKYRFARGPEDEQDKFLQAKMVCTDKLLAVPDTKGSLRLWEL
ncbi:hypothetical protein Sste5346_010218 [Sporothrix stenoceras]|uniref:Uncharacterized protein n=1 Tax=Sporothrix stenoceras TaxID=5173 RepID=A0ABR3YGL2_9PEZI